MARSDAGPGDVVALAAAEPPRYRGELTLLLNSRTTRILIEAAEAEGISRASLIGPLGIREADVVDPAVKVEWHTVVRLVEQLSRIVEGDAERLRAVGRRMARVPSYAPLRRVAGAIISVRTLYDVANRYAGPANFPHIRLTAHFDDHVMVVRAEIPSSYTPCASFFRVWEGSVSELSTLLGLPPAVIKESRVTPRTCNFVVELPQSRGLLAGLRRGARALIGARDVIAVLEEQHQELASNVEALRRGRDELRALLDGLPDLALVHSSEHVLWVNGAFLSALGCDAEDVLGRPLADVVSVRPGVLFDDAGREAPRGSRVPVLTEVVLRTRTGREVTVEVAPAQHVVFDGVPARLVVARNITERKRMQQTLIIADRLASVGMLAAGVAHEVNNPLAYVLNNIEIARKELARGEAGVEASQHALGVALEGVDRIRAIVRDLLMLSRGEEGPVRSVDVRLVAESTLALAAHEVDRTTRLVQELSPAPLVRASDGRIAQVLLNLVTNALEAMHGRPREMNQLVVRVARASDGRSLIEVSDTGTGIKDADLPRLFEPFFTTKPAGKGTGLGLSIAQRLVIEVGGEITVSSVLGRGTTFRVLLPPATADEPVASCGTAADSHVVA